MRPRIAITLSAAALSLAACAQDGTFGTGLGHQAEGAAVGAATGAAAGQVLGGDTESTLLGGVVGGVGGALIGAERERREMEEEDRLRRETIIYR